MKTISEGSLHIDSFFRMKSLSGGKINPIHSTISVAPVSVISHNGISNSAKPPCADLLKRVKGLIYLGKGIGIIPCEAFCKKDPNCCFGRSRWVSDKDYNTRILPLCLKYFDCLTCRRRAWIKGSIVSWSISILLFISATVAFIGMIRKPKNNAADLAWAAATWIYYSYGTFL